MNSYSETILQRRRLSLMSAGLVVFAVILVGRLFFLQVLQHQSYLSQASVEHTRKYEVPARRGELYVHDGETGRSPIALNQTMAVVEADPTKITDKAAAAEKIAGVLGGSADSYRSKLEAAKEYAKLADRVPLATAQKLNDLHLAGLWYREHAYRTYPEGQLAAQAIGFVNNDGVGQYGIEQYLNDALSGTPGQFGAKVDNVSGAPIATADNVIKAPQDGASYLLTIDRNIQAMVEQELAQQVQAVHAKSGSVIIMDPNTGAVRAMATYPTYDPNQYGSVQDYKTFLNQTVSSEFEPGSGVKSFTMAAGLDQGKVTPDSTYDDPGCVQVSDRKVCNAEGDKPGKNKTMTDVLKNSLNTGVMYVLRVLGGDPNKITLAGKKILYDYFTNHFGFGQRTGIEQANEAPGSVNPPTNAAGSDVNYANMTFGQGMSVTMVQMVAAMGAIANGGKLYQPHLVDAQINADGTLKPIEPKVVRDHVINPSADDQLNKMLQIVVQHGSGYKAALANKGYKIGGKTGTAQIPRPDGKGYIEGANIGSFIGYAPADNPRFVMMVRINEPGVSGYAETTTVPVFGDICAWLFKYYGIPPSS